MSSGATENREVTGSTPVGATVPFPGFYWERDFFCPFRLPARLSDSAFAHALPTVLRANSCWNESRSLDIGSLEVSSVTRMRRVLGFASVAILGLTLAGCALLPSDPGPTDPIAIGLRGHHLVIVPCEAIDAAKIDMAARGPNPPGDKWVTFFRARGSVPVTAGEEFSMDTSTPALVGTVIRFDPKLNNGTTLNFLFEDKSGQNAVANDSFTLGSSGVPTTHWLQWDGTVTAKPCGYKHKY